MGAKTARYAVGAVASLISYLKMENLEFRDCTMSNAWVELT